MTYLPPWPTQNIWHSYTALVWRTLPGKILLEREKKHLFVCEIMLNYLECKWQNLNEFNRHLFCGHPGRLKHS